MLMIRPLPAGIMCSSASCVRTNAPPRFTSIARHHSAVWACHNGPTGPLMPALLMRMSAVPSFRRSSVTAAAAARWSATSATAAAAMPPARLISPAAAASSSADRAMSPTAAPAPASRAASSLPTPRPPPLTSATIPSSGRRPASRHSAGAKIAIAASVVMAAVTGAGLAACAGIPVGEQPAQDLARRGLGDAVDELHLAHPLVAGHALGHPRHQFLRRRRGPQHDEGPGYLSGQFVGPADDRRVRHRRVGQQDGLELGGRDLVSLVLDQLLHPVGHIEPPVRAGGDDVAGVDPSVGVDRGRARPRIAEVPAHRARRADQQFTRLAWAQIGPGTGVNYPALNAGQGG